ncbi:MAG: hypothetical protein K2P78_03215 [Gemmataceae bacterium]|nr:hypothetical protein [Gemmataceae bacterium]
MTEADFRPLLDATPFEPLSFALTDRSTHDIDRPERVTFSPDGGLLILTDPDGRARVYVSLDHVVSITVPAAPFIR